MNEGTNSNPKTYSKKKKQKQQLKLKLITIGLATTNNAHFSVNSLDAKLVGNVIIYVLRKLLPRIPNRLVPAGAESDCLQ